MLFLAYCKRSSSPKGTLSSADSLEILQSIKQLSDQSFPSGAVFLKEWNKAYATACQKKFHYGQLKAIRVMIYTLPRYADDTVLDKRCNELMDSVYALSSRNKSWQPFRYFTLSLKGSLFRQYEDFDSAQHYYMLSLNTPNSDSDMHYECIYYLALLHFQSNNVKSAARYFEQSLRWAQQQKDTNRFLRCMASLAVCSAESSDTARALYYFNEIDRWTIHDTDKFIEVRIARFHNLAEYYSGLGQYDSAACYFERSLGLSSLYPGKIPYTKEYNKLCIADNMLKSGNFAGARKYFEEVGEVIHNTKNFNATNVEISYYEIGYRIFTELGNYREAIKYLELEQQAKMKMQSEQMAEQLRAHERSLQKLSAAKTIAEKEHRISEQNGLITLWGLLSALLAIGSVAVYGRMKSKQKLEKLNSERRIMASKLEERDRIAQEMHDDMGSTITSMQMALQLYRLDPADEQNRKRIDEISDELHDQMNEVIWRMNTENDYLRNFAAYVYKFARKFLDSAGLQLQYHTEIPEEPIFLPGSVRHCLYLSSKELLNNVVKHAQASAVSINISYHDNVLQIQISDNGKGFNAAGLDGWGNGLKNIRKNIQQMGGLVEWVNQSGTVTTITMNLTNI